MARVSVIHTHTYKKKKKQLLYQAMKKKNDRKTKRSPRKKENTALPFHVTASALFQKVYWVFSLFYYGLSKTCRLRLSTMRHLCTPSQTKSACPPTAFRQILHIRHTHTHTHTRFTIVTPGLRILEVVQRSEGSADLLSVLAIFVRRIRVSSAGVRNVLVILGG